MIHSVTLSTGQTLLGRDDLTGVDFFKYLKIDDPGAQVQWLAINCYTLRSKQKGSEPQSLTLESYDELPVDDAIIINSSINEPYFRSSSIPLDSISEGVLIPGGKTVKTKPLKAKHYRDFVSARSQGAAQGLEWVMSNGFQFDEVAITKSVLLDLPFDSVMFICGLAQTLFMKFQGTPYPP